MVSTPTIAAREALAALSAAIDGVAGLSPADLDETWLCAGLSDLLDAETRLRSVQSRWLGAVEWSDATVVETGRSTRAWLIEEQHLAAGEASRRLRLARGLSGHPATAEALGTAAITAEHGRVILEALRGVPVEFGDAVEAALLEIARTDSPTDLARSVDKVRDAIDGETAAQRAERRYAERGLHLAETFAGIGSLSGTLTSELREAMGVALRAARGLPAPDDSRSLPARNHDALLDIVTFYTAHADTLAPECGERPRVVVTMTWADYAAAFDGHADVLSSSAFYDSGLPLDGPTARRLACDAQIIPAVLSTTGEILDLGRGSRDFNRAIRRAAKLRDGSRCARYGCRNRITDLHHITWWSQGGTTSLANAVWLCTFHHWIIHDQGWTIRRQAPGTYIFTSPDGREHGPPSNTGPPTTITA